MKTVEADQTVYFQFLGVSYEFTFTFESDGSGVTAIGSVENNGAEGPVAVYDLRGVKVADSTASLKSGVYVVRRNGKTEKIVVR